MKDFAIFICTHGRPNAQHTLNTLRSCGYVGKIYLVLDDEDTTINEYLKLYDRMTDTKILVFCKQDYIDKVDVGYSVAKRKAILYAKCFCEDMAKKLSLKAFVIADDDLVGFRFRYEEGDSLKTQQIHSGLQEIIDAYIDFVISDNVCATSFGTSQMYMGGKIPDDKKGNYRVPYNFVFRNTAISFDWLSEMYEDIISVIMASEIGKYTIQLPFVKLEMLPLYAGATGGMTATYQKMPMYERIFQIFKYSPTTIRFVVVGDKLTYAVIKDKAYPKLISSQYRKE